MERGIVMTDDEKAKLTKEAYLEMTQFVKKEIDELKNFLENNFVKQNFCILQESKISQRLTIITFGLILVGTIAGIDRIYPIIMKLVV